MLFIFNDSMIFILFYNKIFAVTFDENFAKATGTETELSALKGKYFSH